MGKLGLVLSGGGAKGAYEIGAYRALRKMGKRPDIVTGTSIGAINGLLIVQGDLYKAVNLWKNISFSTVYDENSFQVCDNPAIADVYGQYVKSFINEGGMDVRKLDTMFDQLYDPNKFYHSPLDFGIVTYNLTKNEPVIMTKKELKPDIIKDYVIASGSCYPAFKPRQIGDDVYIDGGYYDNMPINLAIEMGAEEIVAIDLRSIGIHREPKVDVPITVIAPRNKIVSFLVFDKARSREALRYGYNDTMKTFGKLDGDKYTFKKANMVKNYNKYADKFEKKLHDIFDNVDNTLMKKIIETSLFQKMINSKLTYRNFNELVEYAGECFGFEQDIVYNIKTYNKGLLNELSKAKPIARDIIASKIRNKEFNKILDTSQIIKFFYDAIIDNDAESTFKYWPIFGYEFLVALYIYIIKGNRSAY